MDPVAEIKARLPIEELVGQYCQLKKSGREFKALCPFHNDSKPSLSVAPDKGIAYCFACSSGGDIFSFYQKIEGVDFRQALKDLADRTGVEIKDMPQQTPEKKDEKERAYACIEATAAFFVTRLQSSDVAKTYLAKRGIPHEQIEEFGIGYSPDSFSETYNHLLKEGYSRKEILAAGVGVQKELQEEKIYDRFRNRLMFPIHDHQGRLVAFGGRTLGEDDAKYINSSEGPLYNKSTTLYNFHRAKDAMRTMKSAILVEGYFDVLACRRVGVENVVAVSGTALTEQHCKLLKRSCEMVVLCLDQDRAGIDAAERAFHLLSGEGIAVHMVHIPDKDPDELAGREPQLLKQLLEEKGEPYLDVVLREIAEGDTASADGKRSALKRIVPLLQSLPTSTEREHYLGKAAGVLGVTEMTLKEDLEKMQNSKFKIQNEMHTEASDKKSPFSQMEIALGLFLLYPSCLDQLSELIEPEEGRDRAVYLALKEAKSEGFSIDTLDLPAEDRERTTILQMYCEQAGLVGWSESLARKEIRKNCLQANRSVLRIKQRVITQQLLAAQKEGKEAEAAQLQTQYQQVLKLAKMAG